MRFFPPSLFSVSVTHVSAYTFLGHVCLLEAQGIQKYSTSEVLDIWK